MTTIAYRDGILAADTLACAGSSKIAGITKIARGADGRLGGFSGDANMTGDWLAWIRGDIEKRPVVGNAGTGLVIWPCGKIEVCEGKGSFTISTDYMAIGSGRPEALGAMFAGAGPDMAVRAAMAHDCHTGGDVTVLKREVVSLKVVPHG